MVPLLTQLRTVLWRNALAKKRCWKRTLMEILSPVLLVAVMVVVRLAVHSNSKRQLVNQFPPHSITMAPFAPMQPITASPAVPVTSDIMDHVIEALSITSLYYQVQDDVTSTEASLNYLERRNMTDVGIEFLLQNVSGMVSVEGYVIRMPHEVVHYVTSECSFGESMERCAKSTDGLSTECPGSQLLLSGLLRLQWAVETALIQTFKDPGFKTPALQVQMMPLPVFRPGALNMQLFVSISMVITLTPLAYCVTVTMVTEKKTWAKVMLKVMGLNDSIFWLSWWLTYMLVVVLVSALVTILVLVSDTLAGSGVGYFFLLVVLYGASALGLSSVVSVFFRGPKVAGLMSSVTCVLLALVYLCVSRTRPSRWTSDSDLASEMAYSSVPFGGQLVLSVFSPTALALGLDKLIFDHEENVNTSVLAGQFPLIAVILMLVFDCVLYGLLAIYLDTVVPDNCRLSSKAWFCLTPSYWRGRRDDADSDVIHAETPHGPHIEPVPDTLAEHRTIRIRDLSKSFRSGHKEPVFGLDGLDLDIMEGQITCILGHHGSGKTTLMNILAGVMPPSDGVAFIQNFNVSSIRDQKHLASVVAFCPQRDVIFGDLTVEEHLHITGRLRGITADNLEHEIASILATFHLDKERGTMAWELSGCQRRRLSLAMALLIDTKVILLDEPALGMETAERHHLWNLLHAKKHGRAIVFTSMHMDDADYFSDRKVVLSRGRLRCVGSSDFLKQHFNVGYRLHVRMREATNTERLMRVVRSHVRGASLVRCQDNRQTIALPLSQAGKLTALLRQLESKDRGNDYLGVAHFGVTLTTLDQVFLKLGEEEEGGNVFISPLLTPGEEEGFSGYTMAGTDFQQQRGFGVSSRSPSLPVMPYPASDVTRRRSAFPVLQQRQEVSAHGVGRGEGSHGKVGARSRRLSDFFTKYIHRKKPRGGSGDFHRNPDSKTSTGTAPKRSSLSPESPKNRSKSFTLRSLREDSVASTTEGLEEKPVFLGTVLPTSHAERRATVAAFRDFRSLAQQKTLSSVASVGDHPSMPADPLAKLSVLVTYDRIKEASIMDVTEETTESPTPDPAQDPENPPGLPLKMGEVLTNLQLPKKGVCLELRRLSALLKARVLIHVHEKRWLLLRVVMAVALTLVAVGTSHAVLPEVEWESRQRDRLPLFGLNRLVYRNVSGGPVDHLLAEFSRIAPVSKLASDLSSQPLDVSLSLQSLLDILESNGKAHKLHYNATCALALPHLVSFLGNVSRNSVTVNSTLDSVNNSISNSSNASLASTVSAWLEPWPKLARHENRGKLDWVPVLFLGLAVILTASTFAVRLIVERKEHLRRYVGVMGVSRWLYYLSAVIIDVIEFVIPTTVFVVICAVSRMAVFEGEGSVYSLAVLAVLYMVSGVLWMHAASFLCPQPSIWILCFTPMIALVTVGSFCLVIFFDSGDSERTATVLHYVFTVVWTPYVPFGAIYYMAKVGSKERPLNSDTLYVFQFDANIDICFVMLAVDVVLLSCVVLLLDKLISRPPTLPCSCCKKKTVHHDSTYRTEDDSARKEIQRVQDLLKDHTKAQWPRLVVEGAGKTFRAGRRELMAVDRVTFGVDKGEVLGLLGPRDAGKSTLTNVLMGVSPLSVGSVYMDSKSRELMTRRESSEKIGYCPHYNPLWEGLTVDQHVQFMGQVKGLGKWDIRCFRHSLYHDLDLGSCQSHKVNQLSEGDKRKLSFAMSMMGAQTFMFVDDPSFGMDTRSRRLYWDAVNYFLEVSQRSTVLSTQCTEEAQRLCSRLAVIVNGQLRCLGTTEELQSLCEETYRLEVTLRRWDEQQGPGRMDMLIMFLQELFPGLQKVEQFQQRVLFKIHSPGNPLSLASTFHTLESLKRNLDLEDFTFSQTDMEQMFLDYAREQKEGESRFSPETSRGQHNTWETSQSGISPPDTWVPPPDQDVQPPSCENGEGGASCEDAISDADAAVGVVILHNGDDNGVGVAGGEEGEVTEVGAAGPVVCSVELEGVDNLAYMVSDGEDWKEEQTSL